jgi:hypothetical protein
MCALKGGLKANSYFFSGTYIWSGLARKLQEPKEFEPGHEKEVGPGYERRALGGRIVRYQLGTQSASDAVL